MLALLTEPVLAALPSVSLLVPVPRSTDMAVVSAVSSVMVSLPEPPTRLSRLATVAEFVPLVRVRVSAPVPRSTEPLETAVARVMVSAPEPPISVPALLTVPVLAAFARVSALLPVPRSTDMAGGQCGGERDGVVAGAAGDGLGVGDGGGVGEVAEGEGIAAGAEIDAGLGGAGTEGDGVRAGAADQRADVLDGAGVGDVGEGQLAGGRSRGRRPCRW